MEQDSSESERTQPLAEMQPKVLGLPCFGKNRSYRVTNIENGHPMVYIKRVSVSDETRRLRQICVRNLILRVLKTQNHDELFL